MENLQFKTFTFPQNPTVYEEKLLRTPFYYEQENGTKVYGGMSAQKRTITGSGFFSGPDAYKNYLKLEAQFGLSAPGELVHPILGTRRCYFTGLELTKEPKENYISYKFTFTGCTEDNEIPA